MFYISKWTRLGLGVVFMAFAIIAAPHAMAEGDPDYDFELEPLPPHPPIPADNQSSTAGFPAPMGPKQELGYLLYFDPKLGWRRLGGVFHMPSSQQRVGLSGPYQPRLSRRSTLAQRAERC